MRRDPTSRPQHAAPEGCPELDCLTSMFDPALLQAAEQRARQLNITADRVLINWRMIDEEAYLRRLSASLQIGFEDFSDLDRGNAPVSDAELIKAIETGTITVQVGDRQYWVIAPRDQTVRQLGVRLFAFPAQRQSVRLTSHAQLAAYLQRIGGKPLADHAVWGLQRRQPALSAAPPGGAARRHRVLRRAAVPMLIAGGLMVLPLLSAWVSVPLSIAFLCFSALRIVGCIAAKPLPPGGPRIPDSELPVYSIVAALYQEAPLVGKLITCLRALDYPHEKLQIILALEADDPATRAAIDQLGPIPNLQIVIAPRAGPRTKPKALNYALPFVRGSFVAIYDAEDEPEPGQLRAAFDAFRCHGPDVACVQASLCIAGDNDNGWLTQMFAAEYAGQFELFMPGAAALGLPLPLGGSSNHFRTETLRACGAWDPFNVTEDADLGLRLARRGHRAKMFASTTSEEAPATFRRWLPQRTRWMKGWMQTWAVHMRSPARLSRDLGWRGFIAVNLLIGGNVLSALACPGLVLTLLVKAAQLATGDRTTFLQGWNDVVELTAAFTGFVASIAVGVAGLQKRRRAGDSWILALTPLYWLMLSIAAWRALYQLVQDPYRWEKTEHGPADPAPASRLSGRGQAVRAR